MCLDCTGLVPVPDAETIRQLIFALTYTPHGGSGLTWGWSDVQSLSWEEGIWYAERLNEQREAEAEAMQAAQKSR